MTEPKGWLKLHRTIMTSSVFSNPKLLKFWIWILCKAFSVPSKVMVGLQEVNVEKGQFVFGRFAAANELQMTNSSVYKYLKILEKEQMIVVKSNNKFSLVSVVNWCDYQDKKGQEEQQSNNKVTTKEQQSNTNKELKNIKNSKKKDIGEFTQPSLQEIKDYTNEKQLVVEPEFFFNYFTANNWVDSKGNEVKSWKQKMLTWDKRERAKNPKPKVPQTQQDFLKGIVKNGG